MRSVRRRDAPGGELRACSVIPTRLFPEPRRGALQVRVRGLRLVEMRSARGVPGSAAPHLLLDKHAAHAQRAAGAEFFNESSNMIELSASAPTA